MKFVQASCLITCLGLCYLSQAEEPVADSSWNSPRQIVEAQARAEARFKEVEAKEIYRLDEINRHSAYKGNGPQLARWLFELRDKYYREPFDALADLQNKRAIWPQDEMQLQQLDLRVTHDAILLRMRLLQEMSKMFEGDAPGIHARVELDGDPLISRDADVNGFRVHLLISYRDPGQQWFAEPIEKSATLDASVLPDYDSGSTQVCINGVCQEFPTTRAR